MCEKVTVETGSKGWNRIDRLRTSKETHRLPLQQLTNAGGDGRQRAGRQAAHDPLTELVGEGIVYTRARKKGPVHCRSSWQCQRQIS